MQNTLGFTLAFFVPGAILFALHFFPWRALLGADLPRLGAYAVGVIVIAGAFAGCIWLIDLSALRAILLLAATIAGAGSATAMAWAIDAIADLRSRYAGEQAKGSYLERELQP